MSNRDFKDWFAKFKTRISSYQYYVDFNKVHAYVNKIKIELNILNSLVGSEDIENQFERILEEYPEALKCMPILLAVRSNEIYAIDEDGEFTYSFNSPNYSVEEYKSFMRKTGLFELIH